VPTSLNEIVTSWWNLDLRVVIPSRGGGNCAVAMAVRQLVSSALAMNMAQLYFHSVQWSENLLQGKRGPVVFQVGIWLRRRSHARQSNRSDVHPTPCRLVAYYPAGLIPALLALNCDGSGRSSMLQPIRLSSAPNN